MYKVHGYVGEVRRISRMMHGIPRVGDTVRFSDAEFGIVTEIVWCMDEDEPYEMAQRVNIRIKSESEVKAAPRKRKARSLTSKD